MLRAAALQLLANNIDQLWITDAGRFGHAGQPGGFDDFVAAGATSNHAMEGHQIAAARSSRPTTKSTVWVPGRLAKSPAIRSCRFWSCRERARPMALSGDFQERCHSLAAIQAVWIDVVGVAPSRSCSLNRYKSPDPPVPARSAPAAARPTPAGCR